MVQHGIRSKPGIWLIIVQLPQFAQTVCQTLLIERPNNQTNYLQLWTFNQAYRAPKVNFNSTMHSDITWLKCYRCLGGVEYCLNISQVDLKRHPPCGCSLYLVDSVMFISSEYINCVGGFSMNWHSRRQKAFNQPPSILPPQVSIHA